MKLQFILFNLKSGRTLSDYDKPILGMESH
jgi:hypothetical protein